MLKAFTSLTVAALTLGSVATATSTANASPAITSAKPTSILVLGVTYLPVHKAGTWYKGLVNGKPFNGFLKEDLEITPKERSLIARLDDDGKLFRYEDRPLWGATNVTKTRVTLNEARAAGSWVKAYNRKTGQAAVGKVKTVAEGYPVTKAWALAPGSTFKAGQEWRGGPQVDLASLPLPRK